MKRLYGAAARSLERALVDDPYRSDWEEQHKRISAYYQDDRGHVICGCGVHQAFCPTCDMPRIVAYEQENQGAP